MRRNIGCILWLSAGIAVAAFGYWEDLGVGEILAGEVILFVGLCVGYYALYLRSNVIIEIVRRSGGSLPKDLGVAGWFVFAGLLSIVALLAWFILHHAA